MSKLWLSMPNQKAHGKGSTVLEKLGRLKSAINAYDEAIKSDPADAEAWNNKGNILGKLQRYKESIAATIRHWELTREMSKHYVAREKSHGFGPLL